MLKEWCPSSNHELKTSPWDAHCSLNLLIFPKVTFSPSAIHTPSPSSFNKWGGTAWAQWQTLSVGPRVLSSSTYKDKPRLGQDAQFLLGVSSDSKHFTHWVLNSLTSPLYSPQYLSRHRIFLLQVKTFCNTSHCMLTKYKIAVVTPRKKKQKSSKHLK